MAVFTPYAPEKAVLSRWILAACAVALAAYGCYSLYVWSPESWRAPMFGWEPLGPDFPLSWTLIATVVLFGGAAAGVWYAVNHSRLVDFLAETEVEMTKVSWSSRREVVGSSLVVLATVVILGVWIFVVDFLLSVPWGGYIAAVYHKIFG